MEDNNLSEQQNEFLKALEESDNKTHFKLGSVVSGKIVQFDDTDVFIDFNYKVEGKINRNEFDKEPVKGEEIEAVIKGQDNNKGYVILSKREIDKRKAQDLIEDAVKNATPINGVVKEAIKGGFTVSIMGHSAFCPFSQIDISRGIKEADYIGKEFQFKEEFYKKRLKIK